MSDIVRRLYVEKKRGFDIEAGGVCAELSEILRVKGLTGVRIINRYDVQGLSPDEFTKASGLIFSEPQTDDVFYSGVFGGGAITDENGAGATVFAIESLPGQFDQRADSASQCVAALTGGEPPTVRYAKIIMLLGKISDRDLSRVKQYMINPVECREASFEKPPTLKQGFTRPPDVGTVDGFTHMGHEALASLCGDMGFAMDAGDLAFCAAWFRDFERRDPTVTELRVIDTYWSDHCRHTTFLTELCDVEISDGYVRDAYSEYLGLRAELYGGPGAQGRLKRPVTLMDIATIAAKKLKKDGKLEDLDVSGEVNACSITVDVDVCGDTQEWLVMFKNETHNHPTEIEPFGGAATCLGGAIRDPLSGRTYVYQAMRVTGSADPRADVADTLAGKLPQRKITTSAAAGYSSYGNQIGVPTGHVREIYHPGYVAKRLEIGAVVGAAPKSAVLRGQPGPGDAVILLGGRTGRDGIGGATGSSKKHDESSLATCGSEVQKGNPPEERKLLRLFRDPGATGLIKRCNDFGAGGVAVAVGELAAGLDINLDLVPKKYEGLDGTEIAISESQERMAVVVAACDAQKFIDLAAKENLEATVIASVNASGRLVMSWRGRVICDISRELLDSNGASRRAGARVDAPSLLQVGGCADAPSLLQVGGRAGPAAGDLKSRWLTNLSDLNVCSQEGLASRFDCTVGGNTVLMPFGGCFQKTPVEGMAAKIPVPLGLTTTATLMTFGFDPYLSSVSPFHGAYCAVVESLAKIAALGGDIRRVRLSFQEFFEKPGSDPVRWGKPLAALLGALRAQLAFGVAAIGGKDSMSGSFGDLDVPPTLVSFALAPSCVCEVLSPEFKRANGGEVVLLTAEEDPAYPGSGLPDACKLKNAYIELYDAVCAGKILAAYPVCAGGVAAAVTRMCFGNRIGFRFSAHPCDLFAMQYGSIVLELADGVSAAGAFPGSTVVPLGVTTPDPAIAVGGAVIGLDEALAAWEAPLDPIFPMAGARQRAGAAIQYSGGSMDAVPQGHMASVPPVHEPSVPPANTQSVPYTHEPSVPYAHEPSVPYAHEPSVPYAPTHFVPPTHTQSVPHASTPSVPHKHTLVKPRVFVVAMPGTNCEYESAYAFERAGAAPRIAVVRNRTAKDVGESIDAVAAAIRNANIIMLPGGFSAGDEPDGSGKFTATFFRSPRLKAAVADFLGRGDGLMLGICNGFQALVKLGLLPYGEIKDPGPDSPTLTFNRIGRFISYAADVTVCDNSSPWLAFAREGGIYKLPVAHGEGRFFADDAHIEALIRNRQIATRFTGPDGKPTMEEPYNPNGSKYAIEGITSPDGRILGQMGHPERNGPGALKNVSGDLKFDIFTSGVAYFM